MVAVFEILDNLKKKILRIVIIAFTGVIVAWFLADPLISIIKSDLLPSGAKLIAYSPLEFILLKVTLSVIGGILLAGPFTIYWVIKAVRPHTQMGSSTARWLVIGLLLFASGLFFAYRIMMPMVIGFLYRGAVGAGLEPLFSISSFITFILVMSIITGLVFVFPLVMVWLVRNRIVSIKTLKEKRKFAYVGVFIVGAFITDPSPITQLMIAGPLLAFYEIGILVSKVFG